MFIFVTLTGAHCALAVFCSHAQMTDALKNLLTAMWDQASAEDREPYEKKEQEDQARCVFLSFLCVSVLYWLCAVVRALLVGSLCGLEIDELCFATAVCLKASVHLFPYPLHLSSRYERELLAYNAAKAAFVTSQGSGAASGSVKKKKPKVEKAAA
jgi:hypothetical protein